MLKTISPIDNSVFVERPYATLSEIENVLHLSDQTKLKWKNTSFVVNSSFHQYQSNSWTSVSKVGIDP